jgi:lipopolysaccharide heptosyltransferase II
MAIDREQPVRRLLAVRMDNIGDVVMLGPALRGLHRAFPGVDITLLASPAGTLAAPLLPWVSRVMTWRAVWQDVSGSLPQDAERELALAEDLRQQEFDAAWIFTSFSQSPFPPAYLCYLAGIPERVGHSKEFGGQVLTHAYSPPPDAGHQAERNLALLENYGIPVEDRSLELVVPPVEELSADQRLLELGLRQDEPFILAAPGASCSARRYPPERFAEAVRLTARETGLPVVIAGSQRERETIAPVIAAADGKRIFSLVGQTTIPEFARVVQRSALALANNSATLHFADAFRRPQVVLYSGTEHETQWQPRASNARLLRQPTSCSPCFRFTCPYQLECLDIAPEVVAQAARELLGQGQAAAASLNRLV